MERVTISKAIYDNLIYESIILNCLLVLGVDDWERYGDALTMSFEQLQEKEE